MGDLNAVEVPAEQSATQWVSRAVSSSQRQRSQQEQQLIARGKVLMQMYQSQSGKRKSHSFGSSSSLRVVAGASSLPSSPSSSSSANGKKGDMNEPSVVSSMALGEYEALQQDNAQLSADLDQQLGYLRDAIAMQEHLETQQMRVNGIVMMLQQKRANDAKIVSCIRLESADQDLTRKEGNNDMMQTLERARQDRERLELELQQSHATIEHLEAECIRREKAALDKQTRFQHALFVKAAQLDQLCKDIQVPAAWERFVDEDEIMYYRPTQYNGPPELEDPRVAIALTKLKAAPLSFSSRSTAGRITWHEKKRSASTPQPHQFHRGSAADSWCEEIEAPPDNKHKITDFETPLPHGWEMRVTAAGYVFFVNRYTNLTTWTDPRKVVQRLQQQHAAATAAAKDETESSSKATMKKATARPQKQRSISLNGNESLSIPQCAQSDEETKAEESDKIHRFDVVFQEPCSIGIHFQANIPDAGATVRRVLPDMAAARTNQLLPFDRLVAVNKNPVDAASFRHVMLLMQGGLRPLTLTFERDPTASRKKEVEEAHSHHLDEELICDEVEFLAYEGSNPQDVGGNGGNVRERRHSSIDIEQDTQLLEVRPAPAIPEDLTVADKIITNLFSLFWTPPDPSHPPQTV